MPNIIFNFSSGNSQISYPAGTFTIKEFLTHNGVEINRDNQVQCQKKFNKAADKNEMIKSKAGNQSAYSVVGALSEGVTVAGAETGRFQCEAPNQSTEPSSASNEALSQELIDEELCRGSGKQHGKFRIYDVFSRNLSVKENADFLKHEYGTGGSHPAYGIGLGQNHSSKGLEIVYGEEGKEEIRTLLTWNKVAKRIGELITADRYLTEEEKGKLPNYIKKLIADNKDVAGVMATGTYTEKVTLANAATEAYHDGGNSPLTDAEYDKLEDSIAQEEQETGIVSPESPTVNVGAAVSASHLTKVSHGELLMMSLEKTKDVDELNRRVGGNNNYIAMPKFDGCAVRLKYDKDGNLYQAVTRGNGKEGADITIHAKCFGRDSAGEPTVGYAPLHIPEWYPKDGGELWIDGEAMIIESNALAARATVTSKEDKEKSLRNLTSGMLKRLDNTHSRLISFFPYRVRKGSYAPDLWGDLVRLNSKGFNVKAKKRLLTGGVTSETQEQLETYAKHFKDLGIGIDGLVFVYSNYETAAQMGTTSKFPKHSIAFKFRDEEATTFVESIDYQIGVQGGVTPCVNFQTVELEETEVSRATLNNIPFYNKLNFGVGDKIVVRKANQIIPQVVKALTHTGERVAVEDCPVCGTKLQKVYTDSEWTDSVCTNYDCSARAKARLLALVDVSGLDVKGIGVKMIEKLYDNGVCKSPAELLDFLINSDGIHSTETLEKLHVEAVTKFNNAKFENFLVGMCIPSVGISLATDIAQHVDTSPYTCYDNLKAFVFSDQFAQLDGVGDTIVSTVRTWFENYGETMRVCLTLHHRHSNFGAVGQTESCILKFPAPEEKVALPADAPTVVITGTFEVPRAELSKQLGDLGFKVQGACNKQTQYLLAGGNTGAVKISKAAKLGIPVVDSVDRLLELSGK